MWLPVIEWIIIRSLCSYRETSFQVVDFMLVSLQAQRLARLVSLCLLGLLCVMDFMCCFCIRAPRFMELIRLVRLTSLLVYRLV